MKNIKTNNWILLLAFLLISIGTQAQITTDSDATISTEYSSGSQDNIYIFCTTEGNTPASLTAKFSSGAASNYEWLKYNDSTNSFAAFNTDNSGATSSSITNLQDGAYRVNVTSGGSTETYTAWVFNSWYTVTAAITESDCENFLLEGNFSEASPAYNDLTNGNDLNIYKNVQMSWEEGGIKIAAVKSPRIYNPKATDVTYRLVVSDRFNCEGEASVTYNSIVTVAKFSATPVKGEAPLEVTFTNTSENADRSQWFFFKALDVIKKEAEETGTVLDSIMDTNDLDENPVYTYENSGRYQVKLVTTNESEFYSCTDTFYLADYIVADTSFIDAPNVFTPNGDGSNDEFVVKYWSVKEIKINIFNRWGKRVHQYQNSSVGGFETTVTESAWDGKIGGRMASPGAYYYVVEATGRDFDNKGKARKRWAHGFVQLFREN